MPNIYGKCCLCDDTNAVTENLYTADGTIADPLRTVDIDTGSLTFANGDVELDTVNLNIQNTSTLQANGNPGNDGDTLQKVGGLVTWAPAPSTTLNNIAVHLPNPTYFFPTSLSNVNLATVYGTSQQYTLAGGIVSLNNVATEQVYVSLYANVRLSDSGTSFNIYIAINGVNTLAFRTQKIQAGDTNHYTSININSKLVIPAGGQITVRSQRAVGSGTMQIDPTSFNPTYSFMLTIVQIPS